MAWAVLAVLVADCNRIDYTRLQDKLAAHNPSRQIAVVIPELVEGPRHQLFLRHRATLFKTLLRLRGTTLTYRYCDTLEQEEKAPKRGSEK